MPRKGEIINPLRYARGLWNKKKGEAKARGIEFHLTFEEWYNWFLSQGVDKNIPQKNDRNAWAICRKGDTGPYSLDNIYLATLEQNSKDCEINRKQKGYIHPSYHTGKQIETPDGVFYVDEAAKFYNITPQAIRWRLKHNSKGFKYASSPFV